MSNKKCSGYRTVRNWMLIGAVASLVWFAFRWFAGDAFRETPIERAITKLDRPVAWVAENIRAWLIQNGFVHGHDGVAALAVLLVVLPMTGAMLGGIVGLCVFAVRRHRGQRHSPTQ